MARSTYNFDIGVNHVYCTYRFVHDAADQGERGYGAQQRVFQLDRLVPVVRRVAVRFIDIVRVVVGVDLVRRVDVGVDIVDRLVAAAGGFDILGIGRFIPDVGRNLLAVLGHTVEFGIGRFIVRLHAGHVDDGGVVRRHVLRTVRHDRNIHVDRRQHVRQRRLGTAVDGWQRVIGRLPSGHVDSAGVVRKHVVTVGRDACDIVDDGERRTKRCPVEHSADLRLLLAERVCAERVDDAVLIG